MSQKIATFIMKASTVTTIIAIVIIVFGPVIWLEWPYVSAWPLLHAAISLWSFSHGTHTLRDLWLAGVFLIAITVWELIDLHLFSEKNHPAVPVGLVVLLFSSLLYLVGLCIRSVAEK